LTGVVAKGSTFTLLPDASLGTTIWSVDLGGGTSIATAMLTSVLQDGDTRSVATILGDDASPADPSITLVSLPFFRSSVVLDPSFAVLVSPGGSSRPVPVNGGGSLGSQYNTPLIILSSVLTGLAVLMVVVAVIAYFIAMSRSSNRSRTVGNISGSASGGSGSTEEHP